MGNYVDKRLNQQFVQITTNKRESKKEMVNQLDSNTAHKAYSVKISMNFRRLFRPTS
jgi:hypothetical protein